MELTEKIKKFIEWIGSNGPYWSYDKKLGTWIGTGYGTPTTEELWDIFLRDVLNLRSGN